MKAQFLKFAIDAGERKAVDLPVDESTCEKAVDDYRAHRREVRTRLERLASTRSADKKIIARIGDEMGRQIFLYSTIGRRLQP